MKAILVPEFGPANVMQYQEVDLPKIGDQQVLIRVAAASVNFADIKSRFGNKGGGKLPYIPGIDAAGTIEKIGSNVEYLKVGQRVIAFPLTGSYAEYIVADENLTFVLPNNVDFGTAAASPIVSFLSYKLLANVARLEKGETVVVHAAAGGVGTTAIQMAKILGAGQIIGTVGSQEKIPIAKEAGADQVICYSEEDFSKRVNELTNGEGANVILDSIAGEIAEKSLECLATYGRLVHFGNSGGAPGQFLTKDLHASCRSVLGFSFGTTRKLRPHLLRPTAEKVLSFLASGQLKIQIGKVFSLDEAVKAHEWVESRKSTGKVLLKVEN
ncbi:NADPH2:quinone reductase [Salirhabdus euzebyi]|uniref:NADPH2:quinone reductase n=1 Tax=Salirhabdus euzebyi TaxID=394506 RepID=A0A841Q9Y2_9BACI|nr:zinc-binding dehydrogenase [Salirhabdus euzebyi]MBB6455321.1 NADPH2:quinone reductase [Salirhabdus euzebyi]